MNKQFTLQDAEKIFAGTFYSDDEDDNEEKQKDQIDKDNENPNKSLYFKQNNLLKQIDDHLILKEFEKQAI